jgi:hypothetical protein
MPRYYFNLYQGSQLISEDDAGYVQSLAELSLCGLERGQAEHLHHAHIARGLLDRRFLGRLASFLRLRQHGDLRGPR